MPVESQQENPSLAGSNVPVQAPAVVHPAPVRQSLQLRQAPPPLPQAAAVSPVTQTPAWTQPLHVQAPPTH